MPLIQGTGLPGDPVVERGGAAPDPRPRPTGLESVVLRARPVSTPEPATAQAPREEPLALRPAERPFALRAPGPPQGVAHQSRRSPKREAWLAKLDARVEARARALASGREAAAQEVNASVLLRYLERGRRLAEVAAEVERRRVAEFAPLSPERRALADAVVWAGMQLDVLRALDASIGVSLERTRRFTELAERIERLVAREARRAMKSAARREGVPRAEARRASRELEEWVRTGR